MRPPAHGFEHTALLYDGPDDFAAAASTFVLDGLEGDEIVVVVTTLDNSGALRAEIGAGADEVQWGAAEDWYLRPGVMFERFLDTLTELAITHRGRIRVVGEQVHTGRPAGEVRELVRYDALANDAFRASGAWVLCPYHAPSTPGPVLDQVRCAHPRLLAHGEVSTSDDFVPPRQVLSRGDAEDDLPLPPPYATVLSPDVDAHEVRRVVAAIARGFLSSDRIQDLVFAVNEVVANADQHGSGTTGVTVWLDGVRLICEVTDAGPGLADPLCGYVRPDDHRSGGRGLWLARQLADLVEVRTWPGRGTTVRVHAS